MRAHHLRCEYKANPLGLDILAPRLSWRFDADTRGAMQTASQVVAADSIADLLEGKLIWDTGKTAGSSSIHHIYSGPALQSRQRVFWRVRVWDENGVESAWSDPAFWEMGLMTPGDWKAKWITPDWEEDTSTSQPSPMLRTEFNVDGKVRSARLYVTSLGLYETSLNGRRVGDWQFTPGWTTYSKHIQYQTYDVTGHLTGGANAIGAVLGDGWYRGRLGWKERRNLYGDRLALLLQLHIDYDDGRTEVIVSDEGWQAATGPILASDIYNGETFDARLAQPGWDLPGFDAATWRGVRVIDQDKAVLVAQYGPPVRAVEEIQPVSISVAPFRRNHRRFRPDSDRLGAAAGGRRCGHGDHGAPRRSAGTRWQSLHHEPAHRQSH
ncbi:MAG: alpha-L-rhamnosidase N-terminal domain-containing protein [Anaerolineales bacterium]|nr:alpha-L-rhamnosidase N-terminal domain-containing protein [Anaerolineales bacterium]